MRNRLSDIEREQRLRMIGQQSVIINFQRNVGQAGSILQKQRYSEPLRQSCPGRSRTKTIGVFELSRSAGLQAKA